MNHLFLGNPGTGKSTLINCLVGSAKLRSGLSWGGGLTQDYACVEHDGMTYMDTPGLADETIQEQAAQAITTALRQGGRYKLFFMMRLQNGRVVSEDLVTLERVLNALDVPAAKIRFSVIFNNVEKRQYAPLTQPDSDAFKSVHGVVNGRQFKTDAICFIPAIAALDEASDAVIKLPKDVRAFITQASSMTIDPAVVKPVDPRGFAEQARSIQEEMEKLLQSRAALVAAMATQEHQNQEALQRQHASNAAELQSGRSQRRYAPVSPREDYVALPLTPPPTGAVCCGSENKSILGRKKKLLVVVGVVVGVAVLGTIIGVATTRSSSKKGDGNAPADNATSADRAVLPPAVTMTPTAPSSTPPLRTTATPKPSPVPTAKAKQVGCVTKDDPADGFKSIGKQIATEAAELASRDNKKFFAIRTSDYETVVFDKTRADLVLGNQTCDITAATPVWTVYEVITQPSSGLQATATPALNSLSPNDTPVPSTSQPRKIL